MSQCKRFMDLILAVFVMFVYVTMNLCHKQDLLLQEYYRIEVRKFMDNVSVHGYISIQMYETFLDSLYRAGKKVDAVMTHEKIQYLPEYQDQSWTGIATYVERYYDHEIVDRIYADEAYPLYQDDRLMVNLTFQSAGNVFGVESSMIRTVRIRGFAEGGGHL